MINLSGNISQFETWAKTLSCRLISHESSREGRARDLDPWQPLVYLLKKKQVDCCTHYFAASGMPHALVQSLEK